jgi:hypothetical protein
LGDSSVDVVITQGVSVPLHVLFEAFRLLRSGGALACYEPLQNRTFEQAEALNKNLLLAGFVDSHVESEGKYVRVVSKKPAWEVGITQGIKLRSKLAVQTKWSMEGTDDDVLMVGNPFCFTLFCQDEKDLLSEADLVSPDLSDVGCGTTTKKV